LALKVEGVSKHLGQFALKDINLQIAEGDYFVLLGPTGSGKTVLLELIMGFIHPDKGRIVLNNQDITALPTERRGLGYVPQNCLLFPHMTVFENIEFGLKMRRNTLSARKDAVLNALKLVGLEGIAKRTPEMLSGGERQKIVLARVLVTDPKVVLLDEPLASIDAETSRILREELKRINQELGVAVLHVTHDQIEAFSLARKVAIMKNGQIVEQGPPIEVLLNPVDESVARFLGYENVFRVRLLKNKEKTSEVSAGDVTIRLPAPLQGSEATIAIRPEEIVITDNSLPAGEDWNVLEGIIKRYTDLGPIVEVTVDAGLLVKVFIHKRSFLESNLSEGKHVHLGFRTDSAKIVGIS
jgi:molybdate/tungstate transport system ATP-binding protein